MSAASGWYTNGTSLCSSTKAFRMITISSSGMEKRHLQGPAWFPEPPTLRGHRSRRRHAAGQPGPCALSPHSRDLHPHATSPSACTGFFLAASRMISQTTFANCTPAECMIKGTMSSGTSFGTRAASRRCSFFVIKPRLLTLLQQQMRMFIVPSS